MADETPKPKKKQGYAGGFTLDLSTGKPPSGKRKRKGSPALVQQSINLSTPKPEASEKEEPKAETASKPRSSQSTPPKRATQKEQPRSSRPSGSTLADLLDPDTLARLRGSD